MRKTTALCISIILASSGALVSGCDSGLNPYEGAYKVHLDGCNESIGRATDSLKSNGGTVGYAGEFIYEKELCSCDGEVCQPGEVCNDYIDLNAPKCVNFVCANGMEKCVESLGLAIRYVCKNNKWEVDELCGMHHCTQDQKKCCQAGISECDVYVKETESDAQAQPQVIERQKGCINITNEYSTTSHAIQFMGGDVESDEECPGECKDGACVRECEEGYRECAKCVKDEPWCEEGELIMQSCEGGVLRRFKCGGYCNASINQCRELSELQTCQDGCENDGDGYGVLFECKDSKQETRGCVVDGRKLSCNGNTCGECGFDEYKCEDGVFSRCIGGKWVEDERPSDCLYCRSGVVIGSLDDVCGVCQDDEIKCENMSSYRSCVDGVWSEPTNCGNGTRCEADAQGEVGCKGILCKNNQVTCVGNLAQRCVNGNWVSTPCAHKCERGECVDEDKGCVESDIKYSCDGNNNIMVCNMENKTWELFDPLSAIVCPIGGCALSGTVKKYCFDNVGVVCQGGAVSLNNCSGDQTCINGVCRGNSGVGCNHGEYRCSDGKLEKCNAMVWGGIEGASLRATDQERYCACAGTTNGPDKEITNVCGMCYNDSNGVGHVDGDDKASKVSCNETYSGYGECLNKSKECVDGKYRICQEGAWKPLEETCKSECEEGKFKCDSGKLFKCNGGTWVSKEEDKGTDNYKWSDGTEVNWKEADCDCNGQSLGSNGQDVGASKALWEICPCINDTNGFGAMSGESATMRCGDAEGASCKDDHSSCGECLNGRKMCTSDASFKECVKGEWGIEQRCSGNLVCSDNGGCVKPGENLACDWEGYRCDENGELVFCKENIRVNGEPCGVGKCHVVDGGKSGYCDECENGKTQCIGDEFIKCNNGVWEGAGRECGLLKVCRAGMCVIDVGVNDDMSCNLGNLGKFRCVVLKEYDNIKGIEVQKCKNFGGDEYKWEKDNTMDGGGSLVTSQCSMCKMGISWVKADVTMAVGKNRGGCNSVVIEYSDKDTSRNYEMPVEYSCGLNAELKIDECGSKKCKSDMSSCE